MIRKGCGDLSRGPAEPVRVRSESDPNSIAVGSYWGPDSIPGGPEFDPTDSDWIRIRSQLDPNFILVGVEFWPPALRFRWVGGWISDKALKPNTAGNGEKLGRTNSTKWDEAWGLLLPARREGLEKSTSFRF